MNPSPVAFGSWEPDAISVRPGAAELINNVRPIKDGYAPLEAPVRAGKGISGDAVSAKQFAVDKTSIIFAGTPDKVYRIQGESSALIGSGFQAGKEFGWGMDLFLNEFFCCNSNDGLYKANTASGALSPQSNAPKARFCKNIENFLFLAGVVGHPARVQWSGYENATTWTPDSATQSDINDLQSEYGDIRGISGAPYPSIYQRNAITRVTFVGGQVVFSFNTLERNKGLLSSNSLVSTGKNDYFLSDDGFNVWDGQRAKNIDEGRIKEWFNANITEANKYFVKGAVDFRRKMIFWTWPDSNYYLAYSYLWDRFVRCEYEDGFNTTGLFPVSAPSPGIDLDTDAPGEAAHLDASDSLPDDYDDPFWRDGSMQAGFLHNGDMSLFTGTPLQATMDTTDYNPIVGKVSNISEIWPIVDVGSGSAITAQVGSKMHSIGEAVSFSTAEQRNAAGYCPVRGSGQFFRARITVPAGESWEKATGAYITGRPGGKR